MKWTKNHCLEIHRFTFVKIFNENYKLVILTISIVLGIFSNNKNVPASLLRNKIFRNLIDSGHQVTSPKLGKREIIFNYGPVAISI